MRRLLMQLSRVEHDYPEMGCLVQKVKQRDNEQSFKALSEIVENLESKDQQLQQDILDTEFVMGITVKDMLHLIGGQ